MKTQAAGRALVLALMLSVVLAVPGLTITTEPGGSSSARNFPGFLARAH